MMNNLSAFMKGNAAEFGTVKIAISERFKDENGKAAEWEIKAINPEEDSRLRKEYTKEVPLPGKSGKMGATQPRLDYNSYMCALAAKCVVFPNLNNASLQDSYGVKGAEKLLRVMILPGEYYDLIAEVQKANGFDIGLGDMVEEAKN